MTRLWRRLRAWLTPPERTGWGPVLRAMTPTERADMEQLTRDLHEEFDRLLKARPPKYRRARNYYQLPDCEDER